MPNIDICSKRFIKFTTEDSGIGIKEKDQKSLFKMFGKLSQTNSQINKNGIGLGLIIC
jgi:K+-sensing histidine kinase KdpD